MCGRCPDYIRLHSGPGTRATPVGFRCHARLPLFRSQDLGVVLLEVLMGFVPEVVLVGWVQRCLARVPKLLEAME